MRAEGRPRSSPNARKAPIPLPAPLASNRLPLVHPSNLVDLPGLRWAARCRDRQFDNGFVAMHAHDEPELVFCIRGEVRITVAGQTLDGRAGDLCVLPPGIPHSLASDAAWENICVLYAGAASLIDVRARTIPVGTGHRVRRWLSDLCGLYDKRPETPGPAADALLLAILADVAEIERWSHTLRSFHPRLAVAVDYLHDRTEARVSAADLARATRTSYSHLSALFRERFGCGPLDYHRQRRMERARNLLLDPYVGVGEVARRLGFDDPSYFVRVFRQSVGVSPNRWRRHAGRGRETDRRPA